ncbi:unnamed protein product [Rotaria sp. Silwood2]|nr:unnamed protein product [Rotaria sp. Silwood2]CAF3266866.1 unnamed protein product [Rotaria sp. Silwood2]CAF3317426.1 unnamed protein product [Rotaria sp. Silwood2]CAF3568211.1 unnamed protein product [Rotaria sp. Silwood2]CAF4519138.1 unnamed protein product [Rotaria sp. Silwood2]
MYSSVLRPAAATTDMHNRLICQLNRSSSSNETNSPPITKKKEDPFATMRSGRATAASIKVSVDSFTKDI